ncbi:MAG: 50S ribosomal protein L24e [Candidatus Nanoarchaeia archaeon]
MKCTFCGETTIPGTGKSYITKDGKILFFCSSKCEKNMLKLGRLPRDMKWTKFYEKGTVAKEVTKEKK